MLNSRRIALSGLAAALSVICLIAVGFLPTMNVVFSCLASLMCVVPMLNQPKKSIIFSILIFLVSGVLGFIITGNITELLPFYLFFAPYAILTVFLDKINLKIVFKIVFKYLLLNISLVGLYFLTKLFVADTQQFKEFISSFGLIVIIGANVVVLLYDYAFHEGVKLVNNLALKFFNK